MRNVVTIQGASSQHSVVDSSDKTNSETIVELGTEVALGHMFLQLKHIDADGP